MVKNKFDFESYTSTLSVSICYPDLMDFCKMSLENSGMYTIPISELIKKRKLHYHLYAGDTQTYVAFKNDIDTFTDRIADCGSDIE